MLPVEPLTMNLYLYLYLLQFVVMYKIHLNKIKLYQKPASHSDLNIDEL